MRDIVLTHYLNAQPDPQRNRTLPSTAEPLRVLRDSVARHGRRLVVLTDCLDDASDRATEFVRVPPGGNPYWYRWHLSRDWLDAHADESALVWCVDGTDTEMLNDPFPHMVRGVLYVGSEPSTVSGPAGGWLKANGPSAREWLDTHPHHQVLNLGLVGGDRDTVRAVCAEIADRERGGDRYEMPAFQPIVYSLWPEHVTGPMVHTLFRANDTRSAAWWRHK